jgi:hypothetical protein
VSATNLPAPIERLDVRITTTLARIAIPTLRIALGIVFLWFGALKFFPGASPAEALAARTIEQRPLASREPMCRRCSRHGSRSSASG